jgi:DNA replication ATP-dependent helicase Dna2
LTLTLTGHLFHLRWVDRRCFAGMKIDSYTLESGPSVTKTHRHTYRLSRSPHYIPPSSSTQIYASTQAKRDAHLLIGHLSAGDVISISIEPDLLSLARGFITDLTPYHVTLGLDHKLDVGVLQSRLGVQQNRARKAVGVGKGKIGLTEGEHSEQMFRIDKDELTSGLGRIRDNLAQLFLSENADERRRDLVVDLSPPVFDAEFAPTPEEISPGLNEDQRRAMEKVLTARDYALILGMPGTGKTTTIVEIILTLVKRGKSVLLTSYTHSAVDTIMVKLLNLELRLLRLGNPDKVRNFSLSNLSSSPGLPVPFVVRS